MDSRLPLIQEIPNLFTVFYCIELNAYQSKECSTSQSGIADSALGALALGEEVAVIHGMHVLKVLARILVVGLGM